MLLWIIFGGIAGWIASLIVGTDESMGIIGNVIVGIAGAFVGGWLSDQMGTGGAPGAEKPTSFLSFIFAVIGACILLVIFNLIF